MKERTDGENRLTQCVFKGNTSAFTYGADGLRRRSVANGATTDFVLDGDSAVRTLASGAADRTWLHGARGPEYERIGTGSPLWNLYDGLGSVLGTVDQNGNIVSTRKYDVYGAVRGSTGPGGTRHKCCGALGHPSDDETGLAYMRARHGCMPYRLVNPYVMGQSPPAGRCTVTLLACAGVACLPAFLTALWRPRASAGSGE